MDSIAKWLGYLGMTAGGYGGWAIGAHWSMGVAIVISMVGTGLGLYVGRRIAHDYF